LKVVFELSREEYSRGGKLRAGGYYRLKEAKMKMYLLREAEFEHPVERAPPLSYQIGKLPFSPAFKSDRRLAQLFH
jgi:hypothetical protein